MEQNKNEVLSELYAIRSVLSIVSQNEDDVQQITIDEINPIKHQIQSLEDQKFDIQYNRLKKNTCKALLDKTNNSIGFEMECLGDIRTRIEELERHLRGVHIVSYPIFCLKRIIIWTILMGILCLTICSPLISLHAIYWPFFILWPIVTAIACFFSIRKAWPKVKEDNSIYAGWITMRDNCKELQVIRIKKIEQLKRDKAFYEDLIQAGKPSPEEVGLLGEIDKIDQAIENSNLSINNIIKTKINDIKVKSKMIISKAIEAYKILSFKDWRDVDLIIYNFETGRADTIKEALYQVDKERRSGNITNATHNASVAICKTLQVEIDGLSSTLTNSLKRFLELVAGQNNNIEQDKVIAQYILINYSVEKMKEILLKKINISSDRLVLNMESQISI